MNICDTGWHSHTALYYSKEIFDITPEFYHLKKLFCRDTLWSIYYLNLWSNFFCALSANNDWIKVIAFNYFLYINAFSILDHWSLFYYGVRALRGKVERSIKKAVFFHFHDVLDVITWVITVSNFGTKVKLWELFALTYC